MLNRLKLVPKFSLYLSLVLLLGIFWSGGSLWYILEHNAKEEITSQALILLETMNSVRNYTSERIQVLLSDKLKTESEFIAETVPAFSSQTVFEYWRENPQYKSYLYKEATINPTNLKDKANNFETEITEKFRQKESLKELSGFINLSGTNKFYISRPIIVNKSSCLTCHSTPDLAPRSQVATYGNKNGYGWNLGEIVGSQIIYVPAEKVFQQARKNFNLMMIIFLSIFAGILLLINYLVKQNVIQPILPMAKLAQKLANQGIKSEENQVYQEEKLNIISQRGDELGYLGRLLLNMAQEVQAREAALKQELQKLLNFQVNQSTIDEQVSEITQTDYFKSLENKAENLRRKKGLNE